MSPCKTIHPAKIKSFNYLINCIQERHHVFTDKPKYALLIGAGCSYKSNIPLGGGVIDICQKLSYFKNEVQNSSDKVKEFLAKGDVKIIDGFIDENGHSEGLKKFIEDKQTILKEKVLAAKEAEEKKLKEFTAQAEWDEYEDVLTEDAKYGFWMDEFDNSPKERQRLIESIIENKEPGGAYILLAYLIERGIFTNILTTNFDDLINDALLYYTNTKCRFYADDEISQFISVYSAKPNIIKLHGDYRFANMRNTTNETVQLSKNLELKMGELLQNFNVVVVGYNGSDHSIMNALIKVKSSNYQLLWCGMNENEVHWRVAHLINNTDNSYFVKINGFDEMMGQLYPHCKKGEPQNLEKKARERQGNVDTLLQQFKADFNQSNVDDTVKAAFNKSKHIDDLLNKGYAAIQDKQYAKAIDYYNEVIDLDPKNASAYNNRGVAYDNTGKVENAFEDYSTAIELDPGYSLAYSNRGIRHADNGDYEKAIADYTKGIEYNSSDDIIYKDRANAYIKLGNYQKAQADYEMASRLKPSDSVYINGLAHTTRLIGNYTQALDILLPVISSHPDDAYMHNTLAEVYAALNNKEGFYTEVEKAMQLGAPVWDYTGDAVYAPYKDEQQFKDLVAKYKKS